MEKMILANEKTKGIIIRTDCDYLGLERFFGMKCVSYYMIQDTDLHPKVSETFFLDTDVERIEGDKLNLKGLIAGENGYTSIMIDSRGCFLLETSMCMDEQTGIISRQDFVENLDSVPHTIYACLARFPLYGDDFEVYTQSSGLCAENEGEWHRFGVGSFELTNSGEHSFDTVNPFLCIRQESTGNAAAIYVLPIGDWMIKVSRIAGDRSKFTIIEAGLSNQGLRLTIQPGERLVLPELLLQGFEGEPVSVAPVLHRYILNRWPGKQNERIDKN